MRGSSPVKVIERTQITNNYETTQYHEKNLQLRFMPFMKEQLDQLNTSKCVYRFWGVLLHYAKKKKKAF